MKPKIKEFTVSTRVTAETKAMLEQIAKENECTISTVINYIVTKYVNSQNKN